MQEEEFDIVSLTPDMYSLYGKLTKQLREKQDFMLYNLLANQVDLYFDREQILVFARDNTAYEMLKKHAHKLPPEIEIHAPKSEKQSNEKTKRLSDLFNGKLVVKEAK